jgi:ribonuclease Z
LWATAAKHPAEAVTDSCWANDALQKQMLENLPFRMIRHKALTIEGYSRAAVQSYWRIPELKIGFELGGSPWSFMGTQTFLITHGHLDHLAAMPVYVARRRMMKMEPPVI